jgi:uncharacterized protein
VKFKNSIFNFTYNRKLDENVIYNTFSKALVLLNDKEFQEYKSCVYEDEKMKKIFIENGILVKRDINEMDFLKYFHYKTKFSNDSLFLTIAPTLDCNFGCPYCYENRRHGKMSLDIQNALIEYIKEKIENGVKYLDITWYGGEPLLYLDIVTNLSKKILVISKNANCFLKMHMVTNGYLLTKEIIALLDQIGITKIQITIDGLENNHNIRRPLRNGHGTFNKIMENLLLFNDSPIEVLVRMNIDNINCNDFKYLRKKIINMQNSNIKVYASPVEDLNKDVVNNVSAFMTTDEFELFTMKACDDGDLSSDDFSVMDDRYCFCTAETENCYVVDNLGDFYKCWDEVGRKEYACFNILNQEEINYYQIAKFLTDDPFSDEKCRNCVYLPLCFGGCKFQKNHLNKSICVFSEETMKKYIETEFFSELEGGESNEINTKG